MTYLYNSLDVMPDMEHLGRTLLSYDRFGVKLQSWRENECDEVDEPFEYRESWANWQDIRTRARQYSGKLRDRLLQASQDYLAEYGGSSDCRGYVPDTQTVSEFGTLRHW
jgi:hypothetical protein